MLETVMLVDHDDQEIELLEAWLPMLSAKERAYLKGATEALLYVQEDTDVPRLGEEPIGIVEFYGK